MTKERSIEGEGCNHSHLRHFILHGRPKAGAFQPLQFLNKEEKASLSSLFCHNNPQFYDEALVI